jgi:nucleotide-binding universal stress UspA family protein
MSFARIAGSFKPVERSYPVHAAKTSRRLAPTSPEENTPQLESVVVPLDGSHFAEHALPIAIGLAKRSGALLKLVRVFTPGDRTTLHSASAFNILDSQLRAEARRDLKQVQSRIVARIPEITVATHLIESPRISETLTRASSTADLVVMATHGRGWLGRLFLGSVAREMLHERGKPILFVRGNKRPVDLSADPVPRHLTVALDGRKSSERVLEAAGLIARVSGAKATLLHIDDPHQAGEPFANSTAESYLSWIGQRLSKAASGVKTRVVREVNHPPSGILGFIDESGTDLIAVTSRWGPPVMGSMIGHLMRKSPVPVLVVLE